MSTETITQEELTAALTELAVRTGNGNSYFPELARNIFEHVKAHREPEHEPGAVVEDACGDVFRRMEDQNERPWLGFSGTFWAEDHPKRPLRKLVPEDPEREVKIANVNFTDGYRAGQREAASGEITGLWDATRMLAKIIAGNARAMEAARIEMQQGDPRKAMQWILNSLPDAWDGPEGTAWDGRETAQEWFDRTESAYEVSEPTTTGETP